MKKSTLLIILFSLQLTKVFSQDTIPFTVGTNNKIYLKVSINNSEPLNFNFDTGADECVIKKSLITKKVELNIDGKEENIGLGGKTMIETSSKNLIKTGPLNQNNTLLAILDYEDDFEDGIIGWKFFKNKIVNINYGIKKIIVYNQLPKIPEEYLKMKTKLIDDLYYIQLSLLVKNKRITDWFELDTGSDNSLMISNDFSKKHQLFDRTTKIGKSTSMGADQNEVNYDLVLLPELRISNYRFYRIPIYLTVTENENALKNNGIIGNNFLKRFHTIIDYKNNNIYIKVNNLVHTSYIDSLTK